MEKLIELLNKYDKIKWDKEEPIYNWKIAIKTKIYQTYLVSARYWFIKWLVDNDKINTRNLNLQVFMSMFSNDGTVEISYEELILMLLAISDEPIELLISILKQDD